MSARPRATMTRVRCRCGPSARSAGWERCGEIATLISRSKSYRRDELACPDAVDDMCPAAMRWPWLKGHKLADNSYFFPRRQTICSDSGNDREIAVGAAA